MCIAVKVGICICTVLIYGNSAVIRCADVNCFVFSSNLILPLSDKLADVSNIYPCIFLRLKIRYLLDIVCTYITRLAVIACAVPAGFSA